MAYTITNLDTGEVTKTYTGDRRTAFNFMSKTEIRELRKNIIEAEMQAVARLQAVESEDSPFLHNDEIDELRDLIENCRHQVFLIETNNKHQL